MLQPGLRLLVRESRRRRRTNTNATLTCQPCGTDGKKTLKGRAAGKKAVLVS